MTVHTSEFFESYRDRAATTVSAAQAGYKKAGTSCCGEEMDLAQHWDTWLSSWLLGLNWSFINMLLTHYSPQSQTVQGLEHGRHVITQSSANLLL
ncbi:hypothetical protein EYF80_024754 [Liparis tanakae]|uniref:Uncharacterized protein n=1 Tax=Liparis tanakae TaxID=230148 RepID=A0A4Z2HIB0_9TELE|nr:hypothetical protein EYF80_024754 [Liparis tanakae]